MSAWPVLALTGFRHYLNNIHVQIGNWSPQDFKCLESGRATGTPIPRALAPVDVRRTPRFHLLHPLLVSRPDLR